MQDRKAAGLFTHVLNHTFVITTPKIAVVQETINSGDNTPYSEIYINDFEIASVFLLNTKIFSVLPSVFIP